MPVKQLKEFLDSHKVKYAPMMHSPAFTSQEIAAAAHVSGKQLAKCVIVKMDGKLAMIVLPANDHVNFSRLREATHCKEIDLASEMEFKEKFSGCEVGAMPPFGNLYNMPVFVSDELAHQDNILFNAGSHSELMRMTYKDYDELVHPQMVAI